MAATRDTAVVVDDLFRPLATRSCSWLSRCIRGGSYFATWPANGDGPGLDVRMFLDVRARYGDERVDGFSSFAERFRRHNGPVASTRDLLRPPLRLA